MRKMFHRRDVFGPLNLRRKARSYYMSELKAIADNLRSRGMVYFWRDSPPSERIRIRRNNRNSPYLRKLRSGCRLCFITLGKTRQFSDIEMYAPHSNLRANHRQCRQTTTPASPGPTWAAGEKWAWPAQLLEPRTSFSRRRRLRLNTAPQRPGLGITSA